MQMECALIAVNVVMAGCFTFSSLRKQALAFPVMGLHQTDGFWCAFWHALAVEHGIIWGFVFLSRRGGKERNACLVLMQSVLT